MKLIVLVFSVIILSSCHYLMPSCRNGFDVYKKPIQISPKFELKIMDGVYSGNKDHFRYFFGNGKTTGGGRVLENNKLDFTYFKSKEYWSDYSIEGDTIVIQGFNHHTSELCRRWVFETKGIITSDTTILLIYKYDYRDNSKVFYNPPFLMSFIPSTIRPDSTLAWYIKKDWYKADLHSSRK